MKTTASDSLLVRSVEQRKCFVVQGGKTPAPPALKQVIYFGHRTRADYWSVSGDFAGEERYASKHAELQN